MFPYQSPSARKRSKTGPSHGLVAGLDIAQHRLHFFDAIQHLEAK
jgi:hypothetical protein